MSDIGAIIGRFQVDELTMGHRALINQVQAQHPNLVILVGVAPWQGTKHDPLDFPTRRLMLQSEYPAAIILPVQDMLDDQDWSNQVDRLIRSIFPKITNCTLYGGRDSFQPHYRGEFSALEIETKVTNFESGSNRRENIGKVPQNSAAFRAGIIYAKQNAWPTTLACVDITMTRLEPTPPNRVSPAEDVRQILLGRKSGENKWRLPGGLVDKGESFEQAARRELYEETGMTIEGSLTQLGSFPVGDWRLKNAGEVGLVTQLFVAQYTMGSPKGSDDLEEVEWFDLSDADECVVKAHRQLVSAVKEFYAKR